MPKGRRRTALEQAFLHVVQDDLSGRVVDLRDMLIAGIALARRATIATRHVAHFDGIDDPAVNPWDDAGPRG